MTLEDPLTSVFGKFISAFMLLVILISCVAYVMATVPLLLIQPEECDFPVGLTDDNREVCEPKPPYYFDLVEYICVVIFTVEYLSRMVSVGFMPARLADCLPKPKKDVNLEDEVINEERDVFKFASKALLEESVKKIQKLKDKVTNKKPKQEVNKLNISNLNNLSIDLNVDNSGGDIELVDNQYQKLRRSSLSSNNFDSLVSEDDGSEMEIEADVEYPWYVQLYKYATTVMNIIDILAIGPFYVEMVTSAGSSLSVIRVLRLARVFRIFKLGKNSKGISMLGTTMSHAFGALGLVGFFVSLGIVFFGSLGHFFEGGTYMVTAEYPEGEYLRQSLFSESFEKTPFVDIPSSMYWAVVTSTSIGYGDMTPTSLGGMCLSIICMYYGVLLMALPITVIGNNFTREYDKMRGNNDEEMIFDSLVQIATMIHQESIAKASGMKSDADYFKLSRLMVIISSFDNTKRDALKKSLTKKIKNDNLLINKTLEEIDNSNTSKENLQDALKNLVEAVSEISAK
jgi:hypothetical protein